VRSAVAGLLQLGRGDLHAVAEASGMSVRSFQRRLAEGGLCFSQLLEEARFEIARQRLLDSGVRVVDVAAELGYTDAANFSRAFRRWSGGLSPRQFRLALPGAGGRSQSRLFGGAIQP
jgi:AraC-like DNA-binding protein